MAGVAVAITTYDVLYRQYITYRTQHLETKEISVGRASGFGTPEGVLTRRWSGHIILKSRGFPWPTIDGAPSLGNPLVCLAIRGWEQ